MIVDRTLNELTSLQKGICRSSIFNQAGGVSPDGTVSSDTDLRICNFGLPP